MKKKKEGKAWVQLSHNRVRL